jgi:hypothetical protein
LPARRRTDVSAGRKPDRTAGRDFRDRAVRAPGSGVTGAPPVREDSAAANSGSIPAVPVNPSAGPAAGDCMPVFPMSIISARLFDPAHAFQGLCGTDDNPFPKKDNMILK